VLVRVVMVLEDLVLLAQLGWDKCTIKWLVIAVVAPGWLLSRWFHALNVVVKGAEAHLDHANLLMFILRPLV